MGGRNGMDDGVRKRLPWMPFCAWTLFERQEEGLYDKSLEKSAASKVDGGARVGLTLLSRLFELLPRSDPSSPRFAYAKAIV